MKNKVIPTFFLCVLCAMLLFSFAGCDSRGTPLSAEDGYAAFEQKIINTAALSSYDVTMTRIYGDDNESVRYVLSSNVLGEPVALKQTDGRTEYYLRGIRYFRDGEKLMKAAVSLDDFLDIANGDFILDESRVSNIEGLIDGVAFDYASADFDSLRITAYFEGVFIKSISADATYYDEGQRSVLSLKYVYDNPGKQPEINLPDNLDEYGWL